MEGALAKLTELPGRAQGPEKTPTFQDVYRDIYSQWIGFVGENQPETIDFPIKYGGFL